MKTQDKILETLEKHRGDYCSGEQLAAELGISRAAVWKAVKRLRGEGFPIDALTNRGYCLTACTDILSEQGIFRYLEPECRMLDIQVLPEVGSTNVMLREKANAGSPEGTVLATGMQTDGKGRLGRHFFSPANTGLYLSLLLRPAAMKPEQAIRMTTIAAVAGCEAVEAVSDKKAMIKWVNDIYLDGRKVSGILTEGSISLETGTMDSVIIGIGINLYPPVGGFPKEIRNTAGTVFSEIQPDGKNRLAAGFLNCFMKYYRQGDLISHVKSYHDRSMVIGRTVSVIRQDGSRPARVLDVDEECRLLVKYEDGTTDRLMTGEISVKMEP